MLLALLLSACTSTLSIQYPTCELERVSASPVAARPGDVVTIQATPLSEAWDAAVHFGPARAEVLSQSREGCVACDACVETAACDLCQDCDACDALCEAECVETLTVRVPELPPGAVQIVLFNSHGASEPLPFEVLGAAEDTAADDSGADDSGADDSGADDSGPDDSNPDDSGPDDSNPDDSGA